MVEDVIAAVSRDEWERLRALAPAGVEVHRAEDGLDGVAFLVPDSGLDVDLGGLPDLRVVQVLSAGTEWIEDRIPAGVTLCNARGARDAPVAEWVVGAVLGAATGLLAAGRRRSWSHEPPHDVAGTTAVIVGYGSIGRHTGRLLEALGVTVRGVGRRAREGVHRMDELPGLLPGADTVILLTPLTDATRGLVDAAFLGRMRDGALFVNAGRGASSTPPPSWPSCDPGGCARSWTSWTRAAARRPPAVGGAGAARPDEPPGRRLGPGRRARARPRRRADGPGPARRAAAERHPAGLSPARLSRARARPPR
jgi:hypothetical protein